MTSRWFALALGFSLAACSGQAKENAPAEPGQPGARRDAGKAKPADAAIKKPAPPSPFPNWSFMAADVGPERFLSACRTGLAQATEAMPGLLAAEGTRTEANLLVPFNQLLMALERSGAVANLIRNVHPDGKVRKAAETCEQEVSAFASELGRNRGLYDALASIDASALDVPTKRLLERLLRDFRREGVDKDEKTRARLEQLDKELVELGQEFTRRMDGDVRSIKLKSAADLAGMPEDFVKAHTAEPGKPIEITTNYPDYNPFMQYADNGELRKQLYIVNRQRGGEENDKALLKILTLRREKAKLLGFANFADYITADKMMKNSANVTRFIERLQRVSARKSKKEYDELLAYKRASMDKKTRRVEDWEKWYIQNKVKAKSYAFDNQEVRPYFPYKQTEDGLLAITARMYDIEYRPATDAVAWHADVRVLDVVRKGEVLGRIYLDMHPREGKYSHAAQFPLVSGVDGVQLPEGVLVCNLPMPTKDSPGLMEQDDVATMFHEFGHLMHHVLGGKQKWITYSGASVEWDFVEAPSQMFEEWASRHESLATFARHHETGEVIPKDLAERMRRALKFGVGLSVAQQTFYASISLNFHLVDPKKLDMNAEVKKLQTRYTPFRFVDGTRFQASFGHLENYSAFYYAYQWSLVIAKDLFSPFDAKGLMDAEVNARYRDRILAPGSSKDAADLIKDFLGREFNYDAFEKDLEG